MSAVLAPHLDARRSLAVRQWKVVESEQRWRGAFWASAAGLVMALGCLGVQVSQQRQPKTFVVAVDSLGRVVGSGAYDRLGGVDERVKRAAIEQWIESLRGVSSDLDVAKQRVQHVFSVVADGTPALTAVKEAYTQAPWTERPKEGTVGVAIESVVAASEKTYDVRWTETAKSTGGEVRSVVHWTASVSVERGAPRDDNPLGLYVTHVSWSQVKG